MPTSTLSLSQMVDLALGTPELGAVNFNVLHTLFHAIIGKLNIGDQKADINEDDKEYLTKKKPEDDTQSEADSAVTGLGTVDSTAPSSAKGTPNANSQSRPVPYHALEKKVAGLQDQLQALNDLPSNSELFQRAKGDGEKSRPVSDMWQNMQLSRRVDANEGGVNKLMSLVEDLMGEMQQLRDQNEELKKQLEKAIEEASKAGKFDGLDDLLKRLRDLENITDGISDKSDSKSSIQSGTSREKSNTSPSPKPNSRPSSDLVRQNSQNENVVSGRNSTCTPDENKLDEKVDDLPSDPPHSHDSHSDDNELNNRMNMYPDPETFNDYVTWTALEDALKGLRENMDSLKNLPERVVIEMSSQTEPASRPTSSRSRASTPGPSAQLQEILEKLGKLSNSHDLLDERVTIIEEELKNKVDKDALEGLGVPQDLLDQLKELQEQLEALQKGKNKLLNDFQNVDGIEIATDETSNQISTPEVPSGVPQDTQNNSAFNKEEIDSIRKGIEIMDSNFERRLDNLEDQLQCLKESFMDLENPCPIISEANVSDTEDNTSPTQSDTAVSTADNNNSDDRIRHSSSLEEVLNRKASELNQKVKIVSQDANRQLVESRENLKMVEKELEKMSNRIDSLVEASSGQGGSRDSDTLARLQQAILQLQGELERINNTTQQLVDDNNNNKNNIENLLGMCNKLEENKADKEFVQTEVEVKADKRHLDGKVNRSLFDSTCDELNKMITEILSKLLGHEDEWKKALSQLSDDLDGKLDRLEFGPIKDELERQLKALLNKLKNLNFDSGFEDDDAAGIRKQLIQKFNCISCDRPVDMMPQGPIPSIPAPNGMPASRSTRPYTTFELDTIRQHAKRGKCMDRWCKTCKNCDKLTNFDRAVLARQAARCRTNDFRAYFAHYGNDTKPFKRELPAPQTQIDIMDLYATQRACGGTHTMTYPNRRMTRLTHMNNLFREDEDMLPTKKEEQDIQGADGHVYKGRQDDKLPNIAMQSSKSPKMSKKSPHPPPTTQSMGGEAQSAKSPRPSSARGTLSASAHGVLGTRPTSARGAKDQKTTEVPTGQDFVPPPPPAPSTTQRSPSPPLVVQQVEPVA